MCMLRVNMQFTLILILGLVCLTEALLEDGIPVSQLKLLCRPEKCRSLSLEIFHQCDTWGFCKEYSYVPKSRERRLKQKVMCERCTDVMRYFNYLITPDITQDSLKEEMKNFCMNLSAYDFRKCLNILKAEGGTVAKFLLRGMEGESICGYLEFC